MADALPTPEEILASAERAGKATPGPWKNEADYISAWVPGGRPNGEIIGRMCPSIDQFASPQRREANAGFSANARTDLPAAHAMIAELLDVISLADDGTGHESGCSSNSTSGPRSCDCDYPKAREAFDRFTTPAWRRVAEELRKP